MPLTFFNKRPLDILSEAEKKQIVNAIRQAESRTSGEIRLFIESTCNFIDPIDRAAQIFYELKMEHTIDRNAVLLYVATQDRQLAIYGDEGIYMRTGREYWENLVSTILQYFNKENFAQGIAEYIYQIGEGLHHFFPYDKATDQNELPDEIVFGK